MKHMFWKTANTYAAVNFDIIIYRYTERVLGNQRKVRAAARQGSV